MDSKRKLIGLASSAVLAAGAMAGRALPSDEALAEPKTEPKASFKGKFPTRTELRKMPKEKRDYWARRMTESGQPAYYRKMRVIQYASARNPAADPEPMTRQVRRQKDRRLGKMPVGMNAQKWHSLNEMPKNVRRRG